ncbi:hypothetical protein MCERE10_03658 [Burkholderiaceae bacterium]
MFNLLRLIFVPLEFFIVAFVIVNVIDGDYIWLIALGIYGAWIIYNAGIGQTLISFSITTLLAIAFIFGGWVWSIIMFVVIMVVYEIFVKIFNIQADE